MMTRTFVCCCFWCALLMERASGLAVPSSERALAQLFGRLADKTLLLDVPGAGTADMRNCCHGGCDNCEYSRVFDEMNAAKSKWIALYSYRQLIDGRDHLSPWSKIFEDEEQLSANTFYDKLQTLPLRPALGPRFQVSDDDTLDQDACLQLFSLLADGKDTVDAEAFVEGLRRLTGEAHGASWRSFSRALSEKIILAA